MKVKINVNESGKGSVFIDDIEIPCRALSYDAAIFQPPKLILDLMGDVDIQGEADVFLRLPGGNMFKVVRVVTPRIPVPEDKNMLRNCAVTLDKHT